ncbi:protein of unknown function [Chitinophaga costaii]|uniref:DUF5117 domain-containing protein n=1 Tax=Chitinophaga costaii TaxID=1335309 RepID=A0A1C4E8F7_9BACT|nr:zinc-dependent metalloprotease [Chitinophaga costaii]PUZ24249.1 DUF5117 domain-containing protein [Chitinophaga costaii]SCC39899.1 protein of unknown function [Chitinophaga costaii]
MKQMLNICLLLALGMPITMAQHPAKGNSRKTTYPANEGSGAKGHSSETDSLPAFEHFYKPTMQTLPGAFTVYRDKDRYFMQIDPEMQNRDILVIGDLKNGPAILAKSSGIIKITRGFHENLNVTRDTYSETASENAGMQELLDKSTLQPVSYVLHIEARGKKTGSYIIDITQQLNQGGDLFSFQNYSQLSTPDPARSGVLGVKPVDKGVVFTVTHSQTDYTKDPNAGKGEDKASTYELELIFQQLDKTKMPVTYSDRRVGFETENYTDFGRATYTAKKVSVIKKWDLRVRPEDVKKYEQGTLVTPAKPILVYLDKSIPAIYAAAIKKGILQWNKCFEAAGFKEALQITTSPDDAWIATGKIMVKWGNAYQEPATTLIDDPRTGEILAARMNVSEEMLEDLLPKYFVQCGMYDKRIQEDLHSPAVKSDLLEYKVAQAMAKLLGMRPNYAGSAAYTPAQLRNAHFVATHGMTSSVTDDLLFNFLPQPGETVDVSSVIPHVGSYDRFAIEWAYREQTVEKRNRHFLKNGVIDPDYYYTAEDKRSPATQHGDLSSDNLEAAAMGLRNIQYFYPQLEKITAAMKNEDDEWFPYLLIATNFLTQYSSCVTSVLPNIGGKYSTVVMRNYNEVPYTFVSKERQQQTFDFLNTHLLQGLPEWIKNNRAQSLDGTNTEKIMLRTAQTVINALVSPDMIRGLLQAEEMQGNKAFTTADLFRNIDHYIFKDFQPSATNNTYTLAIQAAMTSALIDLAAKNRISGGVSDISAVMNAYMDTFIQHLDQACNTTQDPMVQQHYKLMKIQLNNNYINKGQ